MTNTTDLERLALEAERHELWGHRKEAIAYAAKCIALCRVHNALGTGYHSTAFHVLERLR